MRVTVAKVVGILIAAGYVIATGRMVGCPWAIRLAVYLLFPLALIWFPERIGGAKGYMIHYQWIDEKSPPILVTIMGWFLLVGVPLIVYLRWRFALEGPPG